MEELNSSKFASILARMADEKLAKDITILDISNVSVLADFFVICSAESTTQVKALTGYIKENAKKELSRSPVGDEFDSKNRWNLLDYGDVIVHILHKEEREFYAIEKFWSNACTINQDEWMKESEDFMENLGKD